MIHIPILRWGDPYRSMDAETMTHFQTGEPVAQMSRANAGLLERDLRHVRRARRALRELSVPELVDRVGKAGELFMEAELPLGDGALNPEEFIRIQSATTGLPQQMCRRNMEKNGTVLAQMNRILDSLTRGLDLNILSRGFGVEGRGVPVSFQAQSPVLGLVLPNNSPGVHTLWLPVLPLQIGLVLKPGSQEPWTPYRLVQAFYQAGVPRAAVGVYPGGPDVAGALMASCPRSLIFGSGATVEQYRGNSRVQVHGPGFSKILIAEDQVDQWPRYLEMMVESVLTNGGRSCINASSIWAPRHTRAIAEALAERLGPIIPLPPDDPQAALAAFTNPAHAAAISAEIDHDLQAAGVSDMTAKFGPRLVRTERCAYLRPTVIMSQSPGPAITRKEYMFPFATVVECPERQMLDAIGPTLVCSAITDNADFQRELIDSVEIDRLNLGPIPTTQLNWLQPHEGNIVDFLFRARAFQGELSA